MLYDDDNIIESLHNVVLWKTNFMGEEEGDTWPNITSTTTISVK